MKVNKPALDRILDWQAQLNRNLDFRASDSMLSAIC